ncbi:BCCT family transporter [Escherichia coli]
MPLNHLFGVPINETVQVILIVAITGLATISVVTGLDKGMRLCLSSISGLALLLLALVLCGKLLLLSHLWKIRRVLSELVSKTFNLYAYEPQVEQLAGGWTYCTGDGGFHRSLRDVYRTGLTRPNHRKVDPVCCLFRPALRSCG